MEYFAIAYGVVVSILFVCCTRWGSAYSRMIGKILFPIEEKVEAARKQLDAMQRTVRAEEAVVRSRMGGDTGRFMDGNHAVLYRLSRRLNWLEFCRDSLSMVTSRGFALWLLACIITGGLFLATWKYYIIPTLKNLPEQERSSVFRQSNR